MAKEVLKNAYALINTVDLSDHIRSITLPLSVAEIEASCMGSDYVANLAGLMGASVDITFAQDFAAANVDATLWAIYDGGAAVAIKIRRDAGTIGETNPEYQFNVILTNYTPISGSVGALHEVTASFVSDGTIARATSA
jgi:hypothetical protein